MEKKNFLTFQFDFYCILLFYGHGSGKKIQMKVNKSQVEGRTIPGPGAPQDCSVPPILDPLISEKFM
jgi:hypothetical protein